MKKILCLIVCISICFSLLINVNAQQNNLSINNQFEGKCNLNLPYDGARINENLISARINVNSIDINQDNILSLKSEVTYNQETYKLDISGQLFKAITFDKMLVGDVIDNTNNFEVISLAIVKNPKKNELHINEDNSNKELLKLYLLKKDTREFIMFEIVYKDLISLNKNLKIQSYEKSKILEDVTKEHWWIKVFNPKNNDIGIASVHTSTDTKTLTYADGPGNCYEYSITVEAWGNIRDYGSSDTTFDTYNLKIAEQHYYYNGVEYNYDFLKVFGCVATGVITESGSDPNDDTFCIADWGSVSTQETGGLKAEVKLSVGFDLGPLGGSLSWTPKEVITTINPPKTLNYTDAVRGVKIPYEAVLAADNDNYSLVLTKDKGTNTSGKLAGATFSFSVGFYTSETLRTGTVVVAANYN